MRVLKALPVAIAATYFANTAIGCFGYSMPLLSYIGGMSLLPLLFMLLSSVTFGFCSYHRMPLYYCVVEDAVNLIDMTVGLPLDDIGFLALHMTMTLAFTAITIFLYGRCHKEAAPACA